MISDNFVTGDNVYLNELKNFFFEVLGMMSITHYGCIGDGRYDNYGPLQVAIDDANRRGLCYLYVPYGRFRYRGELINRENITFVGNPKAKIYNDRTGEEIEIKQFGVPCGGGSSECKIKFLEGNLYLTNGTSASLDTGPYFTDGWAVIINGETVIPRGTTFYYDADEQRFVWASGYAKYQGGEWVIESGPEPEPPTPPTPEEDEMKAIITTTLEEDLTTTQGSNPIYMDNSISGGTTPSLLTLSDSEHGSIPGVVIIGAGVTKVKVSGLINFELAGENADAVADRGCGIFKYVGPGDTDVRLARADLTIKNIRNGYYNIVIPPIIADVEEGNEIYLAGLFFKSGDIIDTKSYLTVEVVNASST